MVDAFNLQRQLAEPKEEGAVNEAALQIAFAVRFRNLGFRVLGFRV